jgi:phosphopantetheinyl transferase (holo-ACP synthase)
MPLFKSIYIDSSSQILVWEITESFEELFEQVQLNEKSLKRLNGMKSKLHQRAFLSVRMLLKEAGYNDFELYYDEKGKPHLLPKKGHSKPLKISISHSYEFSTIILSSKKVGIDVELQRSKIIKIASKFCKSEFDFLETNNNEDYIKKLTMIWGAKESVYKIMNIEGISFKNHIPVQEFEIIDKMAEATLELENFYKKFNIYFEEIFSSTNSFSGEKENKIFSLVYAFQNKCESID